MSTPFLPRIGGVLSADIAVPEHERELRFYSRVLGTGAAPLWREDLMNNHGTPVIGLGARSAEYAELPLQWMPHVLVAEVAASVERALERNGKALMHGKDGEGRSLWAVLLDPGGAAFGIVPRESAEAPPTTEGDGARDAPARVGCISWLDLTVPDASAARDFYRDVIGWSVQEVAMKAAGERCADSVMLGADGKPAAGICHARGVNQGLPPVWMLYLPVGDLDESLRRVQEEGGKILREAPGSEVACAHAVIQDPVGVCLALVRG